MKLLFIARTYPPLVGGMEKYAFDFYHNLKALIEIKLIANPVGKKNIFFFFIKLLFYLSFNARKFDIIHFNDAVLAPLLPFIRIFSRTQVTFTVHGLDVVYNKFGYQHIVIPFLRKADKIFAVSNHTMKLCLERIISSQIIQIIPNGLDFSEINQDTEVGRTRVNNKIKVDIKKKTILLSLGRLIKRKGHAWFIKNVFTQLPENYLYLIAGHGPEYTNVFELINQLSLQGRVLLLNYVTEDEKAYLFSIAHLFIMPNVSDENDIEGFGIVLLEAARYGVPSIATNIEGISDAIIDGVTGTLVEEKCAAEFINAITQNKIDRNLIFDKISEKFDWRVIGQKYYNAFYELISHNHQGEVD